MDRKYIAVGVLIRFLIASLLVIQFARAEPSLVRSGYELLQEAKDVNVRYYYVHGTTRDQIRDGLNSNGPLDPAGYRRWALTEWKVKWRPGNSGWSNPSCHLSVIITVPELVAKTEQGNPIVSDWHALTAKIAQHELEHEKIVRRRYHEVCDALRERAPASDKEADQIGKRVLQSIRNEEQLFDRATDNGKRDGIRW